MPWHIIMPINSVCGLRRSLRIQDWTYCRVTPLQRVQHYDDVIMGAMVSQITSLTIVYPTVYSGVDQSKYQSSASLAFVHKWPVTRKMFPFDDVIMRSETKIICRNVSGFARDCPYDVWCRWLTTSILYVGPLFGKSILNKLVCNCATVVKTFSL